MRAIGLVLLASLAACSGKGASDAVSSNSQSGLTGSFNQGFAKGFRDKFVAQCVSRAQASTPLKVDFTPICGCSADKLLASKSPAELMKGVPPADAQAVATACAKDHPITLPTS